MGYTLRKSIVLEGIGIHSGKRVCLKLLPSAKGGIVFSVPSEQATIPLRLSRVNPQNLGTNIIQGKTVIRTIEHVMAVLWAFKLTDLVLEVEGGEIPIVDGSGLPIWEAIRTAGRQRTMTDANVLVVRKPVYLFEGETFLIAFPAKSLNITYTISFPQNPIKTQTMLFKKSSDFESQILRARTFGNVEDVEALHAAGRALGASMDNVLAYNSSGYVTPPRFEDEAVRHKILDLLGDLYASGYFVQGLLIAYKTSHRFNHVFVRKLVSQFAGKLKSPVHEEYKNP